MPGIELWLINHSHKISEIAHPHFIDKRNKNQLWPIQGLSHCWHKDANQEVWLQI